MLCWLSSSYFKPLLWRVMFLFYISRKFQIRVARSTIEDRAREQESNTVEQGRVALSSLKSQGRRIGTNRSGPTLIGPAGRCPQDSLTKRDAVSSFSIFKVSIWKCIQHSLSPSKTDFMFCHDCNPMFCSVFAHQTTCLLVADPTSNSVFIDVCIIKILSWSLLRLFTFYYNLLYGPRTHQPRRIPQVLEVMIKVP